MFNETILDDKFYSNTFLILKKEEEERKGVNWEIRMQERKSCEEKAIDLLSKPVTSLTPDNIFVRQEEEINYFGVLNLLDVDNFKPDGSPAQLRFGPTMSNVSRYLYPKKQNYSVNKNYFKILKENIANLLLATDHENIKNCYNALCEIHGVKAALCTILLYAKDSTSYNVMTPWLVKAIIKNTYEYENNFEFYHKYNQFINQFKNKFNFKPQEIDLILSLFSYKKFGTPSK